jgi:hypothetical protein
MCVNAGVNVNMWREAGHLALEVTTRYLKSLGQSHTLLFKRNLRQAIALDLYNRKNTPCMTMYPAIISVCTTVKIA